MFIELISKPSQNDSSPSEDCTSKVAREFHAGPCVVKPSEPPPSEAWCSVLYTERVTRSSTPRGRSKRPRVAAPPVGDSSLAQDVMSHDGTWQRLWPIQGAEGPFPSTGPGWGKGGPVECPCGSRIWSPLDAVTGRVWGVIQHHFSNFVV